MRFFGLSLLLTFQLPVLLVAERRAVRQDQAAPVEVGKPGTIGRLASLVKKYGGQLPLYFEPKVGQT